MSRQWTASEITAIVKAATADWQAGRVNRDFALKQKERNISDAEIEQTLQSRATLICRYRYRGKLRCGFWHPRVKILLAWRPAEEGLSSQFETCFHREDGQKYMEDLDAFEPVRWR